MRNTNIQADLENWPVLTWSRFTAFPYQHLQALSFNFEAVYCFAALMTWFLAVVGSLFLGIAPLMELLFARRFPRAYGIWLCSLFAIFAIPTRKYIARLEGMHAAAARARRARYIWASSFWDEEKTNKILSRAHWTASLNPFLVDLGLATSFTAVVNVALRRGVAPLYWAFTLGPFALEYYFRCIFHSFVQVQWFCSTLELQDQRTLTLFSSLMSTHFFRAWTFIICLVFASALAGVSMTTFSMLRSFFSGQDDSGASWVNYLFAVVFVVGIPFTGLASCALFCFSGYQLWNLVRDTFWRMKRTYSRDDWVRQLWHLVQDIFRRVKRICWQNGWVRRHTTTPDREIQLV